MHYKLLGKSGLRVSEICLGTMTFGEDWGWGASKEESRRIFDCFVDAGGNFIDTANRYTEGTSEKYVGEFIKGEREKFVIGTKYTMYTRKGDPNSSGNHRKNMIQSLEGSLKRLNTDYVDLYWVHAWDFMTPVDEVMRALDDLVRSGKVLYIGISDAPAWIVAQANTMAEIRGWSRFIGVQIEYSLIQRSPEREILPMARSLGIAVTPWAVIGSGVLTGKYDKESVESKKGDWSEFRLSEVNLKIADVVVKISNETGMSPSQVAINWVRNQKGIIIPIISARTVDQVKNSIDSVEYRLSREDMQELDEVSKIEHGLPYDVLEREFTKDMLYAGTYDKIEKEE